MKQRNPAAKAALLGVFCAEAVAVSFLESLLPEFLPLPGVKPGFSNIVTMFCVSTLGWQYGLTVTLFKAVFALLTRGTTAFFMSACGGLLSWLVMVLLFRFAAGKLGCLGIGLLCAVAHNAGQLGVAVVLLGPSVLALSPGLLLAGAAAGLVTGTVLRLLLPVLKKQTERLLSPPQRTIPPKEVDD